MAADTWGVSWGGTTGAWLASWARAPATPETGLDVGGRISGYTFTRKRWREIVALQKAQVEAEERALELGRKAAAMDAQLAERAIELAQADEELRVAGLRKALAEANRAKQAAAFVNKMVIVGEIAERMIREAEEEEEEWLLLH